MSAPKQPARKPYAVAAKISGIVSLTVKARSAVEAEEIALGKLVERKFPGLNDVQIDLVQVEES